MPGYLTKQESIAVAGVADLIIRSLLDRQQFADPLGAAEQLGISSSNWPLFGLLWPSGAHLAARLALRPVRAGERILEIGCGLALASLVGHRRGRVARAVRAGRGLTVPPVPAPTPASVAAAGWPCGARCAGGKLSRRCR